jgi:hypothetical protein
MKRIAIGHYSYQGHEIKCEKMFYWRIMRADEPVSTAYSLKGAKTQIDRLVECALKRQECSGAICPLRYLEPVEGCAYSTRQGAE